jgi:hypothetical protein
LAEQGIRVAAFGDIGKLPLYLFNYYCKRCEAWIPRYSDEISSNSLGYPIHKTCSSRLRTKRRYKSKRGG